MIQKNINILLAIIFAIATNFSYAEQSKSEEKYSPTATIMHHISDANEYHLWGNTSIPLPVILYNKAKGFTFGMSSMFKHGKVAVDGYVLDHGKIKQIEGDFDTGKVDIAIDNHDGHYIYSHKGKKITIARAGFIDLSITKVVFTMILTAIVMFLIFLGIAKKYKKQNAEEAPSGIQSFFEPLILLVKDEIAVPNMGEERANKFLPYLLSIFFFIWILNMIGQIPIFPGSGNATGNIAVTLVLAVFTMLITNLKGNKNYWAHIFNPLGDSMSWAGKLPLYFILWPIELVGVLLKPITLMIRLFANITAGHIIVLSLVSLVFVFGNAGQSVGGSVVGVGIAIPFTLFISLIELLVAFIQAFVFTMLSAMYIGLATEEHVAH